MEGVSVNSSLKAIKFNIADKETIKLWPPFAFETVLENVGDSVQLPPDQVRENLHFIYEDSSEEEIMIKDDIGFQMALNTTKKKNLKFYVTPKVDTLAPVRDSSS